MGSRFSRGPVRLPSGVARVARGEQPGAGGSRLRRQGPGQVERCQEEGLGFGGSPSPCAAQGDFGTV